MGFCPLWILVLPYGSCYPQGLHVCNDFYVMLMRTKYAVVPFGDSKTRSIDRRKRFRINQEDKC